MPPRSPQIAKEIRKQHIVFGQRDEGGQPSLREAVPIPSGKRSCSEVTSSTAQLFAEGGK